MATLLEEVKSLLETKTFDKDYNDFARMYSKIFGHPYNGCKCKREKILQSIIEWYNKNK